MKKLDWCVENTSLHLPFFLFFFPQPAPTLTSISFHPMSLSFQIFSKSFSLFLPFIMYFFSLKLDSMSLFSLSFSFLIASVSTLSTLHPLVLRCTVLPLFCGNPLQFYKTFFMVLVIGVSLLLLPQLNASLSLGSFS